MFYLTVIISATALTALFNILLSPISAESIHYFCLSSCVGTISIIAIDGLFALLIRRLLPKSWFLPNKKIFTVSKKEHRFYQKLKIKSWKDKVPELGGFTSFHKDKLVSVNDKDYLERFLLESNYGFIIHLSNALFGFLIAFLPFCSRPSVWIPIFIVNFVLSLLPAFILRFTSYTLLRLYNRTENNQ